MNSARCPHGAAATLICRTGVLPDGSANGQFAGRPERREGINRVHVRVWNFDLHIQVVSLNCEQGAWSPLGAI